MDCGVAERLYRKEDSTVGRLRTLVFVETGDKRNYVFVSVTGIPHPLRV
jgi:hypothetical protein